MRPRLGLPKRSHSKPAQVQAGRRRRQMGDDNGHRRAAIGGQCAAAAPQSRRAAVAEGDGDDQPSGVHQPQHRAESRDHAPENKITAI